jgi:hypothetical protein
MFCFIINLQSSPNGFEFELLGGCRAFDKSLAKAPQITRNIYPMHLSSIYENVLCLS